MKVVHCSALGIGLYLKCNKLKCSLQNSHLQGNSFVTINIRVKVHFSFSFFLFWENLPLPWKIDAKLGVHLIAKYFGAALSQCLFII